VVHAQAGDQLEQVEDKLTLPESDGHDGEGTDLHPTGGDGNQVGGDPVELHQQDSHDLSLLGDVGLDCEQLLDTQHERCLVVERRQVVHAGAERDALGPGSELHVLLDAGVQVADARPQLDHGLALDLEDESEHAMGRRVLRAHIDHDMLVALLGDAGDQGIPILAGHVVDPAGFAGAGVGRVGVRIGHGPGSIGVVQR
jgi:hypothetical protein